MRLTHAVTEALLHSDTCALIIKKITVDEVGTELIYALPVSGAVLARRAAVVRSLKTTERNQNAWSDAHVKTTKLKQRENIPEEPCPCMVRLHKHLKVGHAFFYLRTLYICKGLNTEDCHGPFSQTLSKVVYEITM